MFRGSRVGTSGGGGGGGSGEVKNITSIDSPYDLPLHVGFLIVDTSTGVVNVNMPDAASSKGRTYYIKSSTSASINRVRVLVSSGVIDNETFVDINNDFAAVLLVSDGVNYFIL